MPSLPTAAPAVFPCPGRTVAKVWADEATARFIGMCRRKPQPVQQGGHDLTNAEATVTHGSVE